MAVLPGEAGYAVSISNGRGKALIAKDGKVIACEAVGRSCNHFPALSAQEAIFKESSSQLGQITRHIRMQAVGNIEGIPNISAEIFESSIK